MSPHNIIHLAGRRFGALVVLHRESSVRRYATWRCQCDCGQQVTVRSDRLLRGLKRACGINRHKWRNPDRLRSLRSRYFREHRSWAGMYRRCNDPKYKNYENYGGRGIRVCSRWSDFEKFVKDMGPKPTWKHTIERKNVNGNYTPRNCVWATRREQGRNKRAAIFVRYQGKRVRLTDLVESLGLSRSIVYARLKLGWNLADAIETPLRRHLAQTKSKAVE